MTSHENEQQNLQDSPTLKLNWEEICRQPEYGIVRKFVFWASAQIQTAMDQVTDRRGPRTPLDKAAEYVEFMTEIPEGYRQALRVAADHYRENFQRVLDLEMTGLMPQAKQATKKLVEKALS